MKIGIIKTVDGSVFRYVNPKHYHYELEAVTVITDKNEEILFPLCNVICASFEEASDETT